MSSYEIKLDNFEGPLDLLLHLIRKNEMDIYNIPMADITSQYLATLDTMKSLNLDIAGEFLLMAATLVHIKSRMLLPPIEEEEIEAEEEDPRAELVRRLLEYQKYRAAAVELDSRALLGRDIFSRGAPLPEMDAIRDESEIVAVGLYELMEAFRQVLRDIPEEAFHEITPEQLSVTDRVNFILSTMAGRERVAFLDLFPAITSRGEVVVTFLAMLELVKMRVIRLLQTTRFGPIWLLTTVPVEQIDVSPLEEVTFGYN
jgi:segregation and condensation protein A